MYKRQTCYEYATHDAAVAACNAQDFSAGTLIPSPSPPAAPPPPSSGCPASAYRVATNGGPFASGSDVCDEASRLDAAGCEAFADWLLEDLSRLNAPPATGDHSGKSIVFGVITAQAVPLGCSVHLHNSDGYRWRYFFFERPGAAAAEWQVEVLPA